MKITKLPKATSVTNDDVTLVVQDGETRQIPRTLLAPFPPDDIQLDGGTLHLTANGVPIGTGAQLPAPVPWAKRVTYNRETLGEKMELACLRATDANRHTATIAICVYLNCAVYTETGEDNISVTPLLSDYRGINYSALTSFALDENVLDISETFHFLDSETVYSMSVKDLEALATDFLAEFRRQIEVVEFSDDGKLLLAYHYIFDMDTTQVTETELEGIYNELKAVFEETAVGFTVRYAEISCSKTAEVIGNV